MVTVTRFFLPNIWRKKKYVNKCDIILLESTFMAHVERSRDRLFLLALSRLIRINIIILHDILLYNNLSPVILKTDFKHIIKINHRTINNIKLFPLP